MVNYSCKCCDFETERKSNYEKHMRSEKHLRKLNGSDASSLSSLSFTETPTYNVSINRITELEYQLKMKDIEIQNIINEYNLKLQMKDLEIKHKEDMIQMLQKTHHQNVEEQPNVKMVITEKPKANKIQLVPVTENKPIETKKETTIEYLMRERKNAITIETFIQKYLSNPQYNKFIKTISYNGNDYTMLSSVKDADITKASALKQICKVMDKIPHNQRPIFCSDERRHKFYILTNEGWIKSNNEEEIDKLLNKLVNSSYWLLSSSLNNIIKQIPASPFLTEDSFAHQLEKGCEIAINYKQQLDTFNSTFCRMFKTNYNISFEKWNGDIKNKLTIAIMETQEYAKEKIKIQLSKITTATTTKYIEEVEEQTAESDEEEYDNEKDEEWR